jgi:hypothetical protein
LFSRTKETKSPTLYIPLLHSKKLRTSPLIFRNERASFRRPGRRGDRRWWWTGKGILLRVRKARCQCRGQ